METNEHREKFKQVAKILGFKFNALYDHGDQLEKGNQTLFVRYEGHSVRDNKYSITAGVKNNNAHNCSVSTEDLTLNIKLTNKKSVEQIANDITKRLIPDANIYLDRVNKRVKEYNEYTEKVNSNLKTVMKIVGGSAQGETLSFYADEHNFYGRIQASSDTVQLTLNSLPVNLMVKILKVLENE